MKGAVFLDSDQLDDFAGTLDAVKSSECLLVLMTGETLCQPSCGGEIVTATLVGIPVVPITVACTSFNTSDFKDRYQQLCRDELCDSFEVLLPHGINVDDIVESFEALLSLESLHLNPVDRVGLDDHFDLLESVSKLFRSTNQFTSFIGEKARASELKLRVQVLISTACRSSRSSANLDAAGGRPSSRQKSSNINQDTPVKQKDAWFIIAETIEFEAAAAARFLKHFLEVEFAVEASSNLDVSVENFAQCIQHYKAFLWLLTDKTLRSSTNCSCLESIFQARPNAVVLPVVIKDGFRHPDESFISSSESAVCLRKVFQNVPFLSLHVGTASSNILKTSITQLVQRVQSMHKDQKLAWTVVEKTSIESLENTLSVVAVKSKNGCSDC